METPARLRLWTGLVIALAATLMVSLALVMSQVREQVRVIGEEAAPRGVVAADLYFALSDLDAQATRVLLAGDADENAGSRIDALGRYRERGRQVDADLRDLTATDSGVVVELMDGLAVYRQLVGQAQIASDRGYYTQATNVLHQRLLPAAERLLDQSEEDLDRAYEAKQQTESTAAALLVLVGGALVVLLLAQQVWLARRFRRLLNPALLAATGIVMLLIGAATVVLDAQQDRMAAARVEAVAPYLKLSRLRAVSYDAAADTSRYVVSGNLAYYRDDFVAKSACLAGEAVCDFSSATGLASLAGPEAFARWQAYERGHARIVALADQGRTAEAIGALTGIKRGDATFDFAYYDAAVAAVTWRQERDFDAALRSAQTTLTGWVVLPLTGLALVVALALSGVRRRLAEYR
ncbi:hypothetical protein AB0M02_12405 [Actinoplanes sp. NPDC051861]|uniref:hypothetical protein n=1 Tax=Actinoplanes sp. NPDC051861 TaxID=3155170 RepID=UPI00342AEFA8